MVGCAQLLPMACFLPFPHSLNEGVRSLEFALPTLTTRDLGSVNLECFNGHSVHWEPESCEGGKK